ncbi:ABC transporter substrate-binding protein [Meiothermus ruber]|uniref:Extracellular ligand-binding receptor n=1 Tax=Meiothermus ruber (strain ATCC 35948 / DSM 1279 / VKM B-1258 / 21) TaxID=504728 RepID=D3PTU1_MEIRD|nr:ABC transporter substrate-binding protein [Meiothermus ruber]ADD28874.1 Extracellular ligand-binding receptor [Meiothermus ruber DSM 1279]AGK05677.1 extracellular ligand-binding receptor [Meiothermus ruber DSM 1279]MCL6530848.1 ABC transporter substrate-binding protein [Meiothermus ruber]GAO75789.1 extracellular ligand-binding receptor [Meiothermus ruber H328]
MKKAVWLMVFLGLIGFSLALAQPRTVKVGFVSTLSGGGAALGIDVRDGFNLALRHLNNQLGGLPVEVIVADDQQNPDVARQAVDRMLKRDRVDFLTGIIFSNILLAVGDAIFEEKVFYISPNAGPSEYAGEQCNPYFVNVAWQNDNLHEAMGQYVQTRRFENVFLLAPNYPAGRDALTGFKRYFKGRVVAEVYHRLNQLDFSAEIAQIRAARPKAVYAFEPGAMGVNFIKQYAEAGLLREIPLFLPGFSADADVIRAVGRGMVGIYNSSQWTLELNNPINQRFVEDFRKTYNRTPTLYASQGYDAALLLDAAIKAVGGDLSKKDELRKAMLAGFNSTRGPLRFSPNGYPIQNYYLRQVIQQPGGEIVNRQVGTIFTNHRDAYVDRCKLR